MKADITINERIKDLRTERGLTQKQLADAVGIAYSTYGDYEQDGYFIPHTAVIALAKYFGVTTDYLLGLSENHIQVNTSVKDLHLSDKAIEVISDEHTNSRLLSELITHPGFKQLLTDAEIYVDGYFDQNIQNNNSLLDFARKKIAEKEIPADNFTGTVEMIHVHQNDYFSHLLANDFLPILEDIKNSHKNDLETSDGGYTAEDYERVVENTKGKSGIRRLGAIIVELLKINRSSINEEKLDNLVTKDGLNEEAATELISKSPIVEPNARKRRRKK
ncbi:MAG: helix-turn-helix domain-containing protein [Lachnospiraceae bacterium]|nr:helix-turn-helix domain-containing protein [Lachnospiraceae bacterium]